MRPTDLHYDTLAFVLNVPKRVLDQMTISEMQDVVDSLRLAMKMYAKVSRLTEEHLSELTTTPR